MAVQLNAITSAGGGFSVTPDSSGVLSFQSAGTTYMTMDASGNLGIGTTSQIRSGKLSVSGDVSNNSNINWGASGNGRLYSDANWGCIFQADRASPSVAEFMWQNGSGTERMRIDSSGNVGIGTTNPQTKLGFASDGTISWGATNYPYISGNNVTNYLTFGTQATERMRIDSSGNLLVGATAADSGSRLLVRGASSTTADYAVVIERANGSDILSCRNDGSVYMPATYGFTTGSAANLHMAADSSLYRSTSSIKYKKNVQDANHGLDDVLKLRAVTYEGKSEADAGKTFGGLIAEEVHEAGLTEFVQYAEDGSPDSIAYGQMVSLAFKAIQEQQAIIEQLKADVEALKGGK